jgi:hypothetical protein
LDHEARYRKLLFSKPYKRQAEFNEAGAKHRERVLMAANQSGKPYCDGWRWPFTSREIPGLVEGPTFRQGDQRYGSGRFAVITYMDGNEPAPWTREDEEQLIQDYVAEKAQSEEYVADSL